MVKLHYEHCIWLNELQWCLEEIKIIEDTLGELVMQITDKNKLSVIEHFQNQYIRQKEVIQSLRHNIKLHDQELNKVAGQKNYLGIIEDHQGARSGMETYRKLYQDLKEEFNRFLYGYWQQVKEVA